MYFKVSETFMCHLTEIYNQLLYNWKIIDSFDQASQYCWKALT